MIRGVRDKGKKERYVRDVVKKGGKTVHRYHVERGDLVDKTLLSESKQVTV